MINFGGVPASSVLPIYFTSYGKTNGESITLTGLAVTDIEIYKGTSITQRSSDAGYTLIDTDGIDVDSVTGLHGFSVDLSDNTDAGFYAAGSFYTVVVSTVTIDSQTVTFIAATFRIMTAETFAGMPKVDVDSWRGNQAASPNVNGVPKVDVTHYNGTAGTFASGRPEVNTTHAAGTAWASGAITAASIATDAITAAKIAADAIGASELAADAVTEIQSGLSTLTAVNVRTAVGLASANLDTQLFAIDIKTTNLPSDPADASVVAGLIAAVDAKVDILDTNVDAILVDTGTTLDGKVDDIKTKTDSLTFTQAGQVDANVQSINDTTLVGDGDATPWGPV